MQSGRIEWLLPVVSNSMLSSAPVQLHSRAVKRSADNVPATPLRPTIELGTLYLLFLSLLSPGLSLLLSPAAFSSAIPLLLHCPPLLPPPHSPSYYFIPTLRFHFSPTPPCLAEICVDTDRGEKGGKGAFVVRGVEELS